ncbi:MAG: hypothetical protein ACHQAX_01935 [Gammaproteobacteria bacterium]
MINQYSLYTGCAKSEYLTNVASHEAKLLTRHPDEPRFKDFVFLGTSGLGVMSYLFQLAEYSTEHTPKLYLLDFSIHVQSFWFSLKDIAEKADTFEAFFARYSEDIQKDAHKIGLLFEWLVDENALKGTSREQAYDFLRRIILNSSIICEDWSNKEAFNYINATKTNDVPMFVFASNIIEFVDRHYRCDRVQAHISVALILENIKSLNPYYSYHTRTSLNSREDYIEKYWNKDLEVMTVLAPDRLIRIGDQEDALKHLQHEGLTDFLGKPITQSQKNTPW